MNETERLLQEITDFTEEAGIASTTFGRLCVNDGKLVSRLRAGASVTLVTAERVRKFISERRSEMVAPGQDDEPDQVAA